MKIIVDDDGMDFDSISLSEIRLIEQEHVSILLRSFKDARLCSYDGRLIIAQYGFRGGKDAVYASLLDYHKYLDNNELTVIDREAIRIRKMKLIQFNEESERDWNHQRIRLAVKSRNFQLLIDTTNSVAEDKKLLADILHDQKMCLCYHND